MGRKTVIIRERYDIAVMEVARLAALGYSPVPLSIKLVGIVMYATMEINDAQLEVAPEQPKGTSVVDEVQNSEVTAIADPVKASVAVQGSRPKKPKPNA